MLDEQTQSQNEDEIIDLSAEQVIDAQDVTIKPVEVPEWAPKPGQRARVYVRTMSMARKEHYVQSLRKIVGHGRKATVQQILEGSGAKLAAETMCHKDGSLMFPERSEHQIAQLGKKSSKALERVIAEAARLNGLSDDDDEPGKNESAATRS